MKKLTLGKPDDCVFGGVCAGLGDYFEIDPVFVRIIFSACVLLFGFGFLPYVILYVAMPKHHKDI